MLNEKCEVEKFPGYFLIPGFQRYCLNSEGVLRRISNGREISWIVATGGGKKNITGGYRVTSIYGDDGIRKGVSRHRLLALLFIPCPGDPRDFTVNHRDGKPGNDLLDNLEWTTRAENNQHAYDTGLRPNGTRPIIARLWKTGEEKRFISIFEAGRYFKMPAQTIDTRVRRTNGVAYTDGLQFKFDDGSVWIDPSVRMCRICENLECTATCVETGAIYIFNNGVELARFLKVSPEVVRVRLVNGRTEPYRGFIIQRFGKKDRIVVQ